MNLQATCPGSKISGGVSNLSFGFRGVNVIREAMHSAFLYHAIKAGMDMGIVNAGMLQARLCVCALRGFVHARVSVCFVCVNARAQFFVGVGVYVCSFEDAFMNMCGVVVYVCVRAPVTCRARPSPSSSPIDAHAWGWWGHAQVYNDIPADLLELVEDVVLNRSEEATERLLERASAERAKLEARGGEAVVADKQEWRTRPVGERLTHALVKGIADYIDEDVEVRVHVCRVSVLWFDSCTR